MQNEDISYRCCCVEHMSRAFQVPWGDELLTVRESSLSYGIPALRLGFLSASICLSSGGLAVFVQLNYVFGFSTHGFVLREDKIKQWLVQSDPILRGRWWAYPQIIVGYYLIIPKVSEALSHFPYSLAKLVRKKHILNICILYLSLQEL